METYDKNGSSNSSYFKISYKLYDEDGVVIGSGTRITNAIASGEKFKNEEAVLYNVLEPGQSYRLEILNTK